MAQVMDRGSDALKSHVSSAQSMTIKQTRKGWCQEILGCEAKTEFKYFLGETEIAHSLEESDCCIRLCCNGCHAFKMEVKELNTEAEMLTVDRPCGCPFGACKCCCYQSAKVTSGGQDIGSMKENCFCCVPMFTIYDHGSAPLYKVHSPTCCGGMCVNCCAEGNPCGKGCCKVGFHVFPADQQKTDGDAPYIGKILKTPKSLAVEIFTEADTFEVTFPEDSTPQQKGLLVGAAIFVNANFFEGEDSSGSAGGDVLSAVLAA